MIGALVESLRLAVDSLRTNLMRSLLTTLGIVIGITTVIAIISVITGLNESFATEISAFGSNVVYVQKFNWAKNDWSVTRKWKNIGFREYEAIKRGSQLADIVAPSVMAVRRVKSNKRTVEDVFIYGVGEGDHEIRGAVAAAGRLLTHADFASNRAFVVIGWDVAENLFMRESPVGKTVLVGGVKMQVVGVLEKRGSTFGVNMDTTVTMPIGTFMSHYGRHRMMTIAVQPKDGVEPAELTDELRGILRRVRKVPFEKPDNFAVNQIDALLDLYRTLTGGLYAAMLGVGAISLLVGGIGIMNIMLVSVTERTKEIGIRKALGARPRAILLQFLVEAIVLASLGGAIGTGLGFALAALISAVSPVPASVQLWSVGVGLGFSSVVGLVFGVIPARRAAAKNPIHCLRFE
ncbi:MAG: ABC transporter permease [Polyangiaceae bacterium]|nr:ABC transporter permease [Polyangiaceae bacterium]